MRIYDRPIDKILHSDEWLARPKTGGGTSKNGHSHPDNCDICGLPIKPLTDYYFVGSKRKRTYICERCIKDWDGSLKQGVKK